MQPTQASQAQIILKQQQNQHQNKNEPLSPTKRNNTGIVVMPCQNICMNDHDMLLILYFGQKCELHGRLIVSNYQCCFIDDHKNKYGFIFPLGFIDYCQRKLDQSNGSSTLQIVLKISINFKFKYAQNRFESSLKAKKILNQLSSSILAFTIEYGTLSDELKLCGKWKLQQKSLSISQAEIFSNYGWKKLINYPHQFYVPRNYLSKGITNDRLIVLSYSFKGKNREVGLYRTGPGKIDRSEQQWIQKAVKQNNKNHIIIEIKNKSIGNNKTLATKLIQTDNLLTLKQSYSKISQLAMLNIDQQKWIQNVIQTKWYEQISLLLNEAVKIINYLNQEINVTLLSQSQIRGAQLVCLVQLLIQSQYRTIQGFGRLIEKQLLQYGFSKNISNKKDRFQDKGIAIIQFLDCTYQLCCIYPLSFEFNSSFLCYLANHIYSNQFGNFLIATRLLPQQQRHKICKMRSIWQEIKDIMNNNRQNHHYLFLNPFYMDCHEVGITKLIKGVSCKLISLWKELFLNQMKTNNEQYISQKYIQILKQHIQIRQENLRMKQILMEQKIDLEKKKYILKELKQLD